MADNVIEENVIDKILVKGKEYYFGIKYDSEKNIIKDTYLKKDEMPLIELAIKGAENVNATITNNVFEVTDRTGAKKRLNLNVTGGTSGGTSVGFGQIAATVDNSTGTPSVTVTTSGTNEAKNFTFAFAGLKGEQGIQGIQGAKGDTGSQGERGLQGERGEKGDMGSIGKISISVDNTTGTPSATASSSKAADGSTDISFSFNGIKGEKGEKGNAFTFADFTPEELASLKGEKGEKGDKGDKGLQGERGERGLPGNDGPKGDKGDAFKYSDFTAEQLAALKGPKGDAGPQGPKGDGTTIRTISATVDDKVGTPSVKVNSSGDSKEQDVVFIFSGLKGEQGPQGIQGPAGPKGDKGDKGEQGIQGPIGETGPKGDAFTYNDFTEDQLAALKGPQGEQGIQGPAGTDGTDGTSAGFGEIVATVDNSTGTPSVTVTTSGTNEAKNFTFAFTGLKGEKGDAGSGGIVNVESIPDDYINALDESLLNNHK